MAAFEAIPEGWAVFFQRIIVKVDGEK